MDEITLNSLMEKLGDAYDKQRIMIDVLFSHINEEDRLKVLGEMFERIQNQSPSDDNAKEMQ